jgi:hypothetical protein
MSVDARIRRGLTMIDKQLPEIDTVTSYANLDRDARRRNRHRRTPVAAAVAAAVVLAGGIYGVVKATSDSTNQPADQPSTTTPQPYRSDGFNKTPGRYRMLVGVDDTGAPINADVTFYDTWMDGDFPMYQPGAKGSPVGGIAIYQPIALAAGTGCLSDLPDTNVAETPAQLAQQLARLPQSTLVQSPATSQASGRTVVHLSVRVNQQRCYIYRVAETLHGNHGISFGPDPVLLNFWVQSLGGIPVVIETWWEDNAPRQLRDQIALTEKSITFVTSP